MIGYLISSHTDYSAPRERLLASMRSIDPHRIQVVVGGCPTAIAAYHYGRVPHADVTQNSYDYTALIAAVESDFWQRWRITHWFLLHDTMELGPDADYLIGQADRSVKATAVWGGQCNLGLYRADYLHACRAQILGLKNCSKRYAVEMEGFLWRQLPAAECASYPGGIEIADTPAPIYDGARRIVEYYSGVDLFKYKANWGQHPTPQVVTP